MNGMHAKDVIDIVVCNGWTDVPAPPSVDTNRIDATRVSLQKCTWDTHLYTVMLSQVDCCLSILGDYQWRHQPWCIPFDAFRPMLVTISACTSRLVDGIPHSAITGFQDTQLWKVHWRAAEAGLHVALNNAAASADAREALVTRLKLAQGVLRNMVAYGTDGVQEYEDVMSECVDGAIFHMYDYAYHLGALAKCSKKMLQAHESKLKSHHDLHLTLVKHNQGPLPPIA